VILKSIVIHLHDNGNITTLRFHCLWVPGNYVSSDWKRLDKCACLVVTSLLSIIDQGISFCVLIDVTIRDCRFYSMLYP